MAGNAYTGPATLAIEGGPPVRPRSRQWPEWPAPDRHASDLLDAVLRSGRWAISSPRREKELFERRFARRFADYVGTRHCIPTDHGSSALVISLEALGLEYGESILVPTMTWTASASAVLRAGLVPVLVDVDPVSGCVDTRTLDVGLDASAIIAVHWACTMADVPAITRFAAPRGMVVIEDAAQAHGAQWLGRSAGSLGRLGCFSMQHAKVLTCGEGGAVVTSDDALAVRLEELRADSRRYRPGSDVGQLELAETATVMGANYCLGEFAAALLCAQLSTLDEQHDVRARNLQLLSDLISDIPGVRLPRHAPEQTRLSLYEVPIIFDSLPKETDNTRIAAALSAELGARVYTPHVPLHRSPLLRPWTKNTLRPLAEWFIERNRGRTFPGAEYLASRAVQLHHSAFLGGEDDMVDLAAALGKVVTALCTGRHAWT